MSDITNTIDYITLVIQAIADERFEAKDWLAMTDDQRSQWKEKLVAEEQSEIDRGHALQDGSAGYATSGLLTAVAWVCVIVLFTLGFKCNSKSGEDDGVYQGATYSKYTIKSPAGATLAAKFKPQASWGALVDSGIETVNRIASAPPNNYDVSDLPASRYTVWYFPRSPKCINPAFLVDASNSPYEGSEWDKDPSPTRCIVCAAGMTLMVGFPVPHSPGMVITDDVGIMPTIVRYEAEHSILFFKDPPRYEQTAYHGEGQGHPILGEGPADPSLKAVTVNLPVDVSDGSRVVAPKGRPACVLLTK